MILASGGLGTPRLVVTHLPICDGMGNLVSRGLAGATAAAIKAGKKK